MEIADAAEALSYVSTTGEEQKILSSEQVSLMDFAAGLGSCICTSESDEKSTHKEATLLMSLSATTPLDNTPLDNTEESLSSDSSLSKRSEFSFTCPSLSLESVPSPVENDKETKLAGEHIKGVDDSLVKEDEGKTPLRPATLLGRPLKLEDADALRLSADAMARNVLQSYQKAMNWRIQTWIRALSAALVVKEKQMLRDGADTSQLMELLNTKEALLVAALQEVGKQITVTESATSFRVLPNRVESHSGESPSKRRRVGSEESLEEIEIYHYTVTHALVLECVIYLETPAGFSEINLEVPGTMEGTFLCGEPGTTEELKSVVVDVDTDMLSAMIENSCRMVARASAESAMQVIAESTPETPVEEKQEQEAPKNGTSVSDEETLLTPAPQSFANDDLAAVVTPRNLFSSAPRQPNVNSMLLTIPDDFDKPRRISPQPGSPALGTSSAFFTPRTPTLRTKDVPLISPPVNEVYREVPVNGPSLPLLVEAACRELQSS